MSKFQELIKKQAEFVKAQSDNLALAEALEKHAKELRKTATEPKHLNFGKAKYEDGQAKRDRIATGFAQMKESKIKDPLIAGGWQAFGEMKSVYDSVWVHKTQKNTAIKIAKGKLSLFENGQLVSTCDAEFAGTVATNFKKKHNI